MITFDVWHWLALAVALTTIAVIIKWMLKK